jgi:hypothetical protein
LAFAQVYCTVSIKFILRYYLFSFSSPITKVIAKADEPGRYKFADISPKMNLEYKFALGEEFEGKGFDGDQHKVR